MSAAGMNNKWASEGQSDRGRCLATDRPTQPSLYVDNAWKAGAAALDGYPNMS